MKRKYRVWDGFGKVDYIAFLTDSEVAELRRRGFYVIPL